MNDIKRIYQELGENICLYPFLGAFYQTNNVVARDVISSANSVRPCSVILAPTAEEHRRWDITSGSIRDARNNDKWRETRKIFIEGSVHDIPDCTACSYNERSGTTSARQMNNQFFADHLDIDIVAEVKQIIANDYRAGDIHTMDYYPSNYCNYQCVMCAGGASSQRHTYEVKFMNINERILLNEPEPDFWEALRTVKIINFTGGETVLQTQVMDMIDYLIQEDLARDIRITLLTNASSYPEKLIEKFREFKSVFYTVSIDGVGEVIEYQRRGAQWAKVEENALKLLHHEFIGSVVNYVLTGINVLSIMDFLEWAHANRVDMITISPVFRVTHLGQAALPPELREIALTRIAERRHVFDGDQRIDAYFRGLCDSVVDVIANTPYDPQATRDFVEHMQREDLASKKALIQVVPEWKPYFEQA
jgi:MoaA/NifB/PqqE/SkfB family radical SAM enzyme